MYGRKGYALCMTKPRQQGLGDAIRARVAELDTTMDRASVDMGVSPNALSRWNTGIEPTPAYYEVLMEFLGVSLDELGGLIVRQQAERAGYHHLL